MALPQIGVPSKMLLAPVEAPAHSHSKFLPSIPTTLAPVPPSSPNSRPKSVATSRAQTPSSAPSGTPVASAAAAPLHAHNTATVMPTTSSLMNAHSSGEDMLSEATRMLGDLQIRPYRRAAPDERRASERVDFEARLGLLRRGYLSDLVSAMHVRERLSLVLSSQG
jgi:hypothetical protein